VTDGSQIDEGHAIHYSAVSPGTRVYSSDDVEVGTVVEVWDNYREHILDGMVLKTASGTVFADGPEVQRTFERAVYLNITAEEVARLPEPEGRKPKRGGSMLGRLLGR
jgi:hypothetical protein